MSHKCPHMNILDYGTGARYQDCGADPIPLQTDPPASPTEEELTVHGLQRKLRTLEARFAMREVELAAAREQIAAKDVEIKALREGLSKGLDLLPVVAQLLDGWHNDGTAWSSWDESVRKRLSEWHNELDSLLGRA